MPNKGTAKLTWASKPRINMNESLHERLESIDWECEEEDTRYLTHDFHPYSSKYIPQIPRNLIDLLTTRGETVLDPFVGSGTTLIECKLLGRNSIGIDINPLACLVSKVKTTLIPPEYLEKETRSLLESIEEEITTIRGLPKLFNYSNPGGNLAVNASVETPGFSHVRYWFQPQVIKELSVIKAHIDGLGDKKLRDFFLAAFSSILRTVSNAASGFGNLMISKKPIEKKFIFEKFQSKVYRMVSRMGEFYQLADKSVQTRIIAGDARKLNMLQNNSADMICTHPPYMASVPYAEYQKLSLWWLRHDPNQLDAQLIGGQRSRKDTAERYIADMRRCFLRMYRIVKSGRYCCVVIGNPVYRGQVWPLNETFKEISTSTGFRLIKEIVRGKYKTTMGKMKQEFILVFQK